MQVRATSKPKRNVKAKMQKVRTAAHVCVQVNGSKEIERERER